MSLAVTGSAAIHIIAILLVLFFLGEEQAATHVLYYLLGFSIMSILLFLMMGVK